MPAQHVVAFFNRFENYEDAGAEIERLYENGAFSKQDRELFLAELERQRSTYTDTLPDNAIVHVVPMKDSHYGREADNTILTGKFRHQRIVWDFLPMIFEKDGPALVALSVVISNYVVQPKSRVEVADGDFIEMDGVVYQIRDDQSLRNPRLVALS